MKRCLIGLVVLLAGFAQGAESGLPQLVIKGRDGGQALPIVEVLVSVEVEGRIAEIIYEIAYQNNTERRHEGEFSLQLPPGATVSTYAIDIRGEMRPAVAVEKERARKAYDTITSKLMDPGIVEREANNTYRTRIFPIEAKSVKRVRIGYLRELGPDRSLDVPLACEGLVTRFQLTVKQPPMEPEFVGFTSPKAQRSNDSTWQWLGNNITLSGSLVLPPCPIPAGFSTSRVEGKPDGVRHFVVQGELARLEDNVSLPWKNVRLIWDASYSGRFRGQASEVAALDQIWPWLSAETTVTMQQLSTELSPEKVISVRDGDGRAVTDWIKGITYDGSADYSLVPPFDGVTLIIGDGVVSSPLWKARSRSGGPVILLNSTDAFGSPTTPAGVDVVLDPRREDFLATLQGLRNPTALVGLARENWSLVKLGQQYRLTGLLPPEAPATLQLSDGEIATKEISTVPTINSGEWNFARRLWAQDRLSKLEWQHDPEQIRQHAMAERLACDFTSLIVLERMEDHILYEIPPPEPELLKEYQRVILRKQFTAAGHAWTAWNRKQHWYQTEPPWIDTELRTEAAAVAIFTKAARSVFDEAAIGQATIPALETWTAAAEASANAANRINSHESFLEWQTDVGERFIGLQTIRDANADHSPEGPFHVSVRGFVVERDVIEGETPFLIRDAIQKVGGPTHYGSLSRVFLYRDGQRTGYNLNSRDAKPIFLRPCDMIVVESEPQISFLSASDPFADGFFAERSSAALGGGSPVFEQPGLARPVLPRQPANDTVGGEAQETTVASFSGAPLPAPSSPLLDQAFLEALRTAADPKAFYQESLSGDFGKFPVSQATVIETARWFSSREDKDLTYRILTNLCELEANQVEGTRALALWLVEFGDRERAVAILKRLTIVAPDEATTALVLYDLARISGETPDFLEAVKFDLAARSKDTLSPVVLTDYFSRGGRATGPAGFVTPQAMPSDLRIVVASAGGEASLDVLPPTLTSQKNPGELIEDYGVWSFDHPRVLEYQVRRAIPGAYRPKLIRWSNNEGPITVRIDTYLRWGTETEEHRSTTLLMSEREMALPEILFQWRVDGGR